jgi:PAS domain S-box-containing protein
MSRPMNEDPVNILLVDDQPGKLLAYEAILGELGERLIKANSAREALDVLLRTEIAVILIDVHMPELDGFELAAIIREHPRHQRAALVFVSAVHLTDIDRLRGYQTGAIDYVSVPIVPEILRAKVAAFADLYRKSRQLEALNRELEARVEERTAALQASTTELRASEERLGLALDSAGAASWDWDAVTDRLDWTPRFRELHGFTEDDPPRLDTVLSRLHDADRTRLRARIDAMLATPGDDTWNESFRVVHPQRGLRTLGGLGRAIRDASGRVIRMTGIDLDITERVRAEQALKAADRRKDEFLATLSHELRNPLAPILNAVQLLDLSDKGPAKGRTGPGLDEAQRSRALAVIQRQVLHMARLVDDLLDVSRITSGKITLQRAPMGMSQVVARALETCGPLLGERAVTVNVVARDGELLVDGDLTRLVQVVANLVNNAAKFTGPGGRIDIETRREQEHAVLVVRDTGVGIAEEMLPRVFDLFTQVSRGSQGPTGGGLGVGLAIVRQLVQMHGGEVTAHSQGPGHGSELMVRLPLRTMPAAEDRANPTPPPRATARRILIADDNDDALQTLSWLLESQGHEVHTARDGLEAVEAAGAVRPEIVILDIGMPNLDGYGAAERIREQPWGRLMKLVAQTGWGQPSDKLRAKQAGFDLHLTKPIDVDRLVAVIAEVGEVRVEK